MQLKITNNALHHAGNSPVSRNIAHIKYNMFQSLNARISQYGERNIEETLMSFQRLVELHQEYSVNFSAGLSYTRLICHYIDSEEYASILTVILLIALPKSFPRAGFEQGFVKKEEVIKRMILGILLQLVDEDIDIEIQHKLTPEMLDDSILSTLNLLTLPHVKEEMFRIYDTYATSPFMQLIKIMKFVSASKVQKSLKSICSLTSQRNLYTGKMKQPPA